MSEQAHTAQLAKFHHLQYRTAPISKATEVTHRMIQWAEEATLGQRAVLEQSLWQKATTKDQIPLNLPITSSLFLVNSNRLRKAIDKNRKDITQRHGKHSNLKVFSTSSKPKLRVWNELEGKILS